MSDPAVEALDVQIVLSTGTLPGSDRNRREHVQISEGLADALGITANDVALSGEAAQIRVILDVDDDLTPSANFTVSAIDPNLDANELIVAIWPPEDVTSTGSFNDHDNGFFKLFGEQSPAAVFAADQFAAVYDVAPASTFVVEDGVVTRFAHFTEPNSLKSKQFRECVELHDDNRVAVLVPHGGGIETRISNELGTLLTAFDKYGYAPSVWEAGGQWGSGMTFERWHVTATQISGGSFPGYAALEDSGPHQYSLGLHGFDRGERAVVMGGRASRQVKCFLLETIEHLLYWKGLDEKITYKLFAPDGADIDLVRASTGSGDTPQALTGVDDLDGSSLDNIVNRIAPNPNNVRNAGGIQIELSSGLRNDTPLFQEFLRSLAFALDGQIRLNPVSNYCAQFE